jgi:integrase
MSSAGSMALAQPLRHGREGLDSGHEVVVPAVSSLGMAVAVAIRPRTPGRACQVLRHWTGTFLLAAGVPDWIVQAILGHGSAALTRH